MLRVYARLKASVSFTLHLTLEECLTTAQDLLLIGPNDLALALLGYAPAKGTEEAFQNAVDKILTTAKKYGKKAGFVVRDGAGAKAAKEKGFDLVALSADGRALQGWYAAEMAKFI
jgi:4-hydroxy-2-oxoheptanedioate aldolase